MNTHKNDGNMIMLIVQKLGAKLESGIYFLERTAKKLSNNHTFKRSMRCFQTPNYFQFT